MVVTDTCHRHGLSWMERNVLGDEVVAISDVTGSFAQINVQGPKSMEAL